MIEVEDEGPTPGEVNLESHGQGEDEAGGPAPSAGPTDIVGSIWGEDRPPVRAAFVMVAVISTLVAAWELMLGWQDHYGHITTGIATAICALYIAWRADELWDALFRA